MLRYLDDADSTASFPKVPQLLRLDNSIDSLVLKSRIPSYETYPLESTRAKTPSIVPATPACSSWTTSSDAITNTDCSAS